MLSNACLKSGRKGNIASNEAPLCNLETTAPQRLSLVAASCDDECMQIRHFCNRLSNTTISDDPDAIAEIHTALLAVRNALHGIRYVCEHEVKRTGL